MHNRTVLNFIFIVAIVKLFLSNDLDCRSVGCEYAGRLGATRKREQKQEKLYENMVS